MEVGSDNEPIALRMKTPWLSTLNGAGKERALSLENGGTVVALSLPLPQALVFATAE